MKITKYVDKNKILIGNSFKNTDQFYSEFASFMKKKGLIKDSAKVKRLLIKRESIQTTAIGNNTATPHIYYKDVGKFNIFIGLIKDGLDFKSADKEKVYVVFLIISDESFVRMHLKILSQIAKIVLNTNVVELIREAKNEDEILKIVHSKEEAFK